MPKLDKFIQYGVPSDLADKAIAMGLTISKCRSVSQSDMVQRFGMSASEVKFLTTAVRRAAIDSEIVCALIEASNAVCCVCKGEKGKSIILHHIIPYEKTQDNSYSNLIVLCPNDHDMAHQSGLSMKHDVSFLRKSKNEWEKLVQVTNEARASKAIDIKHTGIDYININRIEELCISLFGSVPETDLTPRLKKAKILNEFNSFDQKYVSENLSGRKFMFDFITHGETQHYKYLMQHISQKIDFIRLKDFLLVSKLRTGEIQGKYAFFVGGVYSTSPEIPIDESTPPIVMYYKKSKFRIEWVLDPNYVMSMSATWRLGGKNKYLIYSLIGSITQEDDKSWLIKCSPLMICQPNVSTHETPDIAYMRMYNKIEQEELE